MIRFFKENLDFEFRSEFLPFVEHFKYCEYWDAYKWNAQTSRRSRPNCASASPAYTLLSGKSARDDGERRPFGEGGRQVAGSSL